MNIERFHNEIAMRLGYERIVKDKRIMISIDEVDEPCVVLKIQGHNDVRIKASESSNDIELKDFPISQNDIMAIADAVHLAYIQANAFPF